MQKIDLDNLPSLFKVTNKWENDNCFTFKDGLNILDGVFIESFACSAGGFTSYTMDKIIDNLDYGKYLRLVRIPKDDNLRIECNSHTSTYKTNMLILNERYDLEDYSTFEKLEEWGYKKISEKDIQEFAIRNQYHGLLKQCILRHTKIYIKWFLLLRFLAKYNDMESISLLIDRGFMQELFLTESLKIARKNKNDELIKKCEYYLSLC